MPTKKFQFHKIHKQLTFKITKIKKMILIYLIRDRNLKIKQDKLFEEVYIKENL